jgi:hypothetical protein
VSNSDLPATPFLNGTPSLAGPSGNYDDFTTAGDFGADSPTGLVSAAVMKAAIRRSAMFCFVMTIVGLIIGGGLYEKFPAPYQASTSVLLTDGPYENGLPAAGDDQAFAQTRTVAVAAMRELGLSGNVNTFLTKYEVTVESQRVLLVTFSASSAQQAMAGANAVAAQLLRFRATLLRQEQQQVFAALDQQVSQAKQKTKSINTQISQALTKPASPARTARVHNLQAQLRTANASLSSLQQTVSTDLVTVEPATAAAIKGSRLLYPAAPLSRSHLKRILEFPLAGLIAGLVLGMAIAVIRHILSDRPRRRDEIATALGAPVRASTGPLRRGRRPWKATFWRGRARRADIDRIAAHLGSVLPEEGSGLAALAVVAVDDPRAAAMPLVSLASSCALQGRHVVLADLAAGAPAASLLHAGPGVGTVDVQGVRMVTAVPGPVDITPVGPLGRTPARDRHSPFTTAVNAACAGADIVLTLVTLDPALGGEHLLTWTSDAVVITTAGRSTWTKISAVGEMIRLSGTHLASAILVGADRTDESLGAIPRQSGLADEIDQKPLRTEGNGSVVAATDGAGRHRWATGDLPPI